MFTDSKKRMSSCARKPCPRTQVCNPVDKICYGRGTEIAKTILNNQELLSEADVRKKMKKRRQKTNETPATNKFPEDWTKLSGELGFVTYFGKFIAQAQQNGEISTNVACPEDDINNLTLQFWQSMLKWYFRPESPIQRILLGWELGTGKTVGILVALDNYFDDPRPKILFFHTRSLINRFYEDLARFPNKYRMWYEKKYRTTYPSQQNQQTAWMEQFRDVLQSYRAHVDGQSTPLKCFLYNEGGNSSIRSQSIIKQFGATDRMLGDDARFNYSNMIIIGDEAHQLTNPSPDVFLGTQIEAVLRCAERIKNSRNSAVMLMTATPPIHNIKRFMSVVTGKELSFSELPTVTNEAQELSFSEQLTRGVQELNLMKQSGVLEGHIAWYMYRDPRIFAVATPNLASMPILVRCTLTGKQLNSYIGRRFLRRPTGYTVPRQPKQKIPKEDEELIDGKIRKKCQPWQHRNANGRCVKSPAPTGGADAADVMQRLQHLPGSPKSKKSRKSPKSVVQNQPLHSPQAGPKTSFSGRKLFCLDPSTYVNGRKDTDCIPNTLGKYEHHIEYSVKKQKDMHYTEENIASASIKLARMANDALRFPGKVAIIIHRPHFYAALSRVLEMKGLPAYNGNNSSIQTHILLPDKQTGELANDKRKRLAAACDIIKVFNDSANFRGEKQKIILLNSEEYTEGINLADCRLVILGDLSVDRTYPSWALVTQRLARALRQCQHMNLPENERTLETRLYATVMPNEAQIREEIAKNNLPNIPEDEIKQIAAAHTIDEEKIIVVEQQREQTQIGMVLLGAMSIEMGYWSHVIKDNAVNRGCSQM